MTFGRCNDLDDEAPRLRQAPQGHVVEVTGSLAQYVTPLDIYVDLHHVVVMSGEVPQAQKQAPLGDASAVAG